MRIWTILLAGMLAMSLNMTPAMADTDKNEHGKKHEAKHDKGKDKKDRGKDRKHRGDKDHDEGHKPFLRSLFGG